MTSYRLFDGASGRPGTGSSGAQPPTTANGFSGGYITGTLFKVTQPTHWLEGYWWWVCPTGGVTAPQKFCLYSANRSGAGGNAGTVIPASVVTSGTLSTGWNFVPLPTPIPLTQGWTYVAATGFTSTNPQGFPMTTPGQWGSGEPYAAGVTNGPLTAFSDQSGSLKDPFGCIQSCFTTATGGDPALHFPSQGNSSFLGWLDVQVTDQAPVNAAYRLFPSLEQGSIPLDYNVVQDTDGYTIGNTFSLSEPCRLQRIWFMSGSGAAVLPSRCAIWDVATQAVVAGTDNASPAWKTESGAAAAAGGGWCYADYSASGVTLPSGRNMIVSVYSAPGAGLWRGYSIPFWGTGGLAGSAIPVGASGLGNGPVSAPSTASGTPLQGSYSGPNTAWGYPGSWDAPENDWTDVEVAPLATSPSGLLMAGII